MLNFERASAPTDRTVFVGQIFFALGIMGMGIQHFIYSNFIPVILPWWPSWIPGRISCAYFMGAVLFFAGLLIILRKKSRIAATRLGMIFIALLFLILIIQFTQNSLIDLLNLGIWTNTLKEFAFCGSAFVVASSLPQGKLHTASEYSFIGKLENRILPLGKFPLAVMVTVFGIDHFVYVDFVSSLVPAWIPGHIFWTYFAGAALIASGVGIILNIKARLAATLLGAMMFTWVLILHIPRAVADPSGAMGNEWTSVFEALAFSGIAFILGKTLP
jgi:uncharacterized membrane protein